MRERGGDGGGMAGGTGERAAGAGSGEIGRGPVGGAAVGSGLADAGAVDAQLLADPPRANLGRRPLRPRERTADLAIEADAGNVGLALVVHPSVSAKTVPELIALIKATPDGYSYASSGQGSPQHLSGELFNLKAGTKMPVVPYRGSGPAMNDLVGGHGHGSLAHLVSAASGLAALGNSGKRAVRRLSHRGD